MCKRVAAVMYGIGIRLDTEPELLFTLRGVNHEELIAIAKWENARGTLNLQARSHQSREDAFKKSHQP